MVIDGGYIFTSVLLVVQLVVGFIAFQSKRNMKLSKEYQEQRVKSIEDNLGEYKTSNEKTIDEIKEQMQRNTDISTGIKDNYIAKFNKVGEDLHNTKVEIIESINKLALEVAKISASR